MTEKLNTIKLYGVDPEHIQFGGLIYSSDFNTDYRGKDNTNGSTIANRIACDQKNDEKYRNQAKWRKENA